MFNLIVEYLLQVPPTPTRLPPAPAAPLTIDSSAWRIWAFADDAVMVWNQAPNSATQVIQIAVIVVIVIGAVWLIIRYLQMLTSESED